MKFTLLWIFLFVCCVNNNQAQEISKSKKFKLNNSFEQFYILGKVGEENHVFMKFKDFGELVAFDDDMKRVWTKQLPFKRPRIKIIGTNIKDNAATFAYTYVYKKTKYLTLLRTGENGKIESHISVDSIPKNSTFYDNNGGMTFSNQKNYGHCFYLTDRGEKLKYVLFNQYGNKANGQTIPLNFDDRKINLIQSAVSNTGESAWIFIENDSRGDKSSTIYKITATASGTVSQDTIIIEDKTVYDVKLTWNQSTNSWIMGGFYAEKRNSVANGLFYLSNDNVPVFKPIEGEKLFQAVGKVSKKNPGISNYTITDIIAGKNGSVLISAEYRKKERQRLDFNNQAYSDPSRSSIREIVTYSYHNILCALLTPTPSTSWVKTLQKRQLSENDGAYFSSFLMANAGTKLQYFYNDGTSKEANFNVYNLTPNGEAERESLFNLGQEDLRLAPRRGKQIGLNKIILPSIRKKELSFVLITN